MPVSPFRRLYPAYGRSRFDGGLNNKYSRERISDNESPDCQNVIFSEGAVATREGITQLNTASVGSFACDGLYTRHDINGAESMVAWFDGSLYALSGTSLSTVSGSEAVFTAGERVGAAEYENYIFFGNGTDIPMKYKDGEITRHGIYAPNSSPTVAAAATGTVLTGDYQYKVTYVNSNLVESDVNTATTTITVASQNITLTSIPVAPASFGVNSRRLYRTEAGGTDFLRLATISDNTTTTYEDGVADGDLGVAAPTDQGTPPTYRAIVYNMGRMFVIDPSDNLVKYSEIGNPYVFKALSFRRTGDKAGDIPQTLFQYENGIFVGCKRSHWLIYMPDTDDTNWINTPINIPYGSKSPFCMFSYDDMVMVAATEKAGANFVGFASIKGDTVKPDVTELTQSRIASDLNSNRIEPEVLDYNDSLAPGFSAIVHKNRAYITAAKGSSATYNNRVLHFDFSVENLDRGKGFAWCPWTNIEAADFTIYDNKLYYGCSGQDGVIHQMNDGTYNDNSAAIDSCYWTKEFSGRKNEENWFKDWRWLNLLYELSGDYYMDCTIRVDSDSGDGVAQQIDLNPGGSLWGTMIFGTDDWSAGIAQYEGKISIGTFAGKRIQFKFCNQNKADQKFKIYGMNLTYNMRGLR